MIFYFLTQIQKMKIPQTKTLSQKLLGLGLVLGIGGSMIMPGVAEARLIFTTEADGVTSLEIADNTILHEDIDTGAVRSDEILDETIVFADIAARSAKDTLTPEFQNLTIWADPSNNPNHVGTMEADYDVTTDRNFYKWSTNKPNMQYYTLVLQYSIPENFIEWESSNQIELDIKTTNDDVLDNKIDVTLLDTDDDTMVITNGSNITSDPIPGGWKTQIISFDPNQGLADWIPGRFLTLRIRLGSKADVAGPSITQHASWIGKVSFNYKVK